MFRTMAVGVTAALGLVGSAWAAGPLSVTTDFPAPLFVGDARATRFVDDRRFPWHQDRRARLAEVRRIGDVVLHRYALSPRCVD